MNNCPTCFANRDSFGEVTAVGRSDSSNSLLKTLSCNSTLSSTNLLKPKEIAKLFHPTEEDFYEKNNILRQSSKTWISAQKVISAPLEGVEPNTASINRTNVDVDYGDGMKQNSGYVTEISNRAAKLISHQIDYGDIHRSYGQDTGDVLYESETSTDLTNLSHCQNVPRHIIRRNKGRLPYTNCSDDVSDEETVLTRSRRSEIKEEMKCAVHQKLKSNHIESKHPNRQRLPGTQYQEHSEGRYVKPTSPDIPQEFMSQKSEAQYQLNKTFCLSTKYFNVQDPKFPLLGTLKDEPLGGKGDFFAEVELNKLGYFAEDIEWNNLKTLDRRELHPLIHERLLNFVNPDISLMIDEHEFYCHRIVLQCYSPFFDQMNNLQPNNFIEIDPGVSKEAFIAIYAWMLTVGQGGFRYLTRENILQVLIACQILQVTDLEEQCLAFIDNGQAFSEENAFHLFMDASRLKQQKIMDLMVPRIKAFFLHLVSAKEFLELNVEDLTVFLQSNYAIIHCEMEMFMSAVRWLMHNWEERCHYLSIVMQCIRFGLMTPSQLVDIRKNPESPEFLKITQDKAVQKMIDDGMAYAVENSSVKSDHLQRCNLLKLDVPQPRNFSKETKDYKTYNDFLKFLQELHKNPRHMFIKNRCESKSDITSEESFSHSQNSNVQSQDSLYTEIEPDSFLQKNLNQRNKSVPLFKIYNTEKKEPEIRKFDDWYDQKLFREYTDVQGNKIYQPVVYHHASETHRPIVCNSVFSSPNEQLPKNRNVLNDVFKDNKDKFKPNTQDYSQKSKETTVGPYSENFTRHKSSDSPESVYKKKLSLKESAAIIIQSTYRGFKDRKVLGLNNNKNLMHESIKRKLIDPKREATFNCSNETKSRLNKISITTHNELKKSRSSESSLAPINKTNYDVPSSLYFAHHPSILIFGGKNPGCKLTSLNNSCTIYRYLPDSNVWQTVDFLPKPRYHHSTTMLKGKIFVIGGSNPQEGENSESNIYLENWSYDPIKKQWSNKEAKLLTPRKSFGLVTFHGFMFVIGGQDKDNKILSSVERYDQNQKKWEEVTPLPEPLIYPATCVYKNNIWVAGGLNSYPKPVVSSHVYCYDPFKNLWLRSAPLRFGRGFSTLINYEDSLHIIGGAIVKNDELISTDSIDVWDDRQGKWKLKANMAIPRHGHVVAVLGSQMLMIGGSTTKYVKSLNQVDSWCMKTGTWNRQISSLPVPVVGHSLITLPPSTHI
ncbi:uncharacterized protein isoform X2 [Rhodnius prolixus]|uniref:uncharacterized protein isoform X2 n=1 Tax=Rhodnius prolixus TaxID=13249 RepID=UPI003D18CC38